MTRGASDPTRPTIRSAAARDGARPAEQRFGFTLVELLLVVAIMMLAAAAVATNIDTLLPSTRIEASARILAADIASARASAVAQGLPYRIDYDIDESRYRIATPFKDGGGIATEEEDRVTTEWKPFPENVVLREILVGNQTIRSGSYRIEMKPNGNTMEHVVHLERPLPPGNFYLVVQGLTGYVQFFSGDWRPEIVSESDFR